MMSDEFLPGGKETAHCSLPKSVLRRKLTMSGMMND
jgi:hypothetical protein